METLISALEEYEITPEQNFPDQLPSFDSIQLQNWQNQLCSEDLDAWRLAIKAYSSGLRRYIRFRLYKHGLKRDLDVGIWYETWITALQRIKSFEWREPESLRGWLCGIAKLKVYELHRRDRPIPFGVELCSLDYWDELALNGLENESNPEHIYQQIECAQLMFRAFCELSDREQEIFISKFLFNARCSEIAHRYSVERDTVSRVINRACKTIRQYVGSRSTNIIDQTVVGLFLDYLQQIKLKGN